MSHRIHKGRCRSVFDPTLAIIFDYFVLAAGAAPRWKPLSAEKKRPGSRLWGARAALLLSKSLQCVMRHFPSSNLPQWAGSAPRANGVGRPPEQRHGHCHAIVRKPTS
jgi:hypothetical protein